jgi:uncharacterized membrane protein (UPF0182 family)
MQETLEGGLTELFGGSTRPRNQPTPPVAVGGPPADTGFRALVGEARRAYEAALDAQRSIDWARYGEEFRRLGEVLEELGGTESKRRP